MLFRSRFSISFCHTVQVCINIEFRSLDLLFSFFFFPFTLVFRAFHVIHFGFHIRCKHSGNWMTSLTAPRRDEKRIRKHISLTKAVRMSYCRFLECIFVHCYRLPTAALAICWLSDRKEMRNNLKRQKHIWMHFGRNEKSHAVAKEREWDRWMQRDKIERENETNSRTTGSVTKNQFCFVAKAI